MQNQCVKFIIEGTNYANTKGIATALSNKSKISGQTGYQRYTTGISAKWGNFNDFPWFINLIEFDPAEEVQAMKNHGVWARLIKLQDDYNWIIDRFNISTQQYPLQYKKMCSISTG